MFYCVWFNLCQIILMIMLTLILSLNSPYSSNVGGCCMKTSNKPICNFFVPLIRTDSETLTTAFNVNIYTAHTPLIITICYRIQ